MDIISILEVIFIGIVEGITEWLPVSSTGHMIIVDEFIKLNMTDEFKEMFFVVIQLGAILSVVTIYFHKLNPFSFKKSKEERKSTMTLWYKVVIASLPAALIGVPLNDKIDELFYNYQVVALMLIIYGVLFIVIENKKLKFTTTDLKNLSYKTAIYIGLFQVLSLIPGTSRSGATIIGAMLVGTSRVVAAEFTFFLGIPVMFGASLLKIVKFGLVFTGAELFILLLGMAVSYIVSIIAIRYLLAYIKKNDFKAFGYYRIGLGIIVLLYFLIF
jgi:undecaprenyl-diphosphatase